MDIIATIQGQPRVIDGLGELLSVFEDITPIMDAIGFEQREDILSNIQQGKDVFGKPFIPSARAKAQGGQTLIDTRRLWSSINYLGNKEGVEWGSAKGFGVDAYASILNFGGEIRPKNKKYLRFKVAGRWVSKKSVFIPKRQFIGISDKTIENMTDTIIDFLQKAVNNG